MVVVLHNCIGGLEITLGRIVDVWAVGLAVESHEHVEELEMTLRRVADRVRNMRICSPGRKHRFWGDWTLKGLGSHARWVLERLGT